MEKNTEIKLPDGIKQTGPYTFNYPGISARIVQNMAKHMEEMTGIPVRVYKICDMCKCELPMYVKGLDCLSCYMTYDLCNLCREKAPPLICPIGYGCRDTDIKKHQKK